MKKIPAFFVAFTLLLPSIAIAQIAAGPMLGYIEMTEALVWVQTEESATTEISWWPAENAQEKQSMTINTSDDDARIAKFVLHGLQPGTEYAYELIVDNEPVQFDYPLEFTTQFLWQYRTDPPNFKVLAGSCHYVNEPEFDRPGRAYGANGKIFGPMADQQADLMLWLGDNTYLREPDWNTRNGFIHRYSHTRAQPELQRFLASCHHYATWDDHDFGPNDSNGSFVHKETALEVFKMFWANPGFGVPDVPTITTQFRHADVDFFLLDNRYFRTDYNVKTVEHQVLGKAQIDWLIEALNYSKASFKIVAIGGQVLNSAAVYENLANYPDEREELISRIAEEEVHNVIFLTGDRHHAELSRLERDGVVIHDLTTSPLSAGYYPNEEENDHRVKGTKYTNRNFAALSFSGKYKERALTMELFSEEGERIWKKEIQQVQKK